MLFLGLDGLGRKDLFQPAFKKTVLIVGTVPCPVPRIPLLNAGWYSRIFLFIFLQLSSILKRYITELIL